MDKLNSQTVINTTSVFDKRFIDVKALYDEELYPELVDYIYHNQSKFMSEDEKVAAKTAIYLFKDASPGLMRMMKEKRWINDDETTKQLLTDGYEAFKNRLAKRIYLQHKHELQLNLRPKCNKIARTPQAKQCRCFHDWH